MRVLIVCFLFSVCSVFAQDGEASFQAFKDKINSEYASEEKSPLDSKDLKKFKSLPFYDYNPAFRVTATFELSSVFNTFEMPTTKQRYGGQPIYAVYGTLHFTIQNREFVLNVYQSQVLKEKEGYEDYLFFPFTDMTSDNGSYAVGRYIDLKIPDTNTIILDFNHAYNPYCAYSDRYSCPIPPEENHIDIEVNAGVSYPSKKKKIIKK